MNSQLHSFGITDLCECSDKGCSACKGYCKRVASDVLYRVDMADETGTAFCNMCADDAMESGLFTDSKERDARQAEYPNDIDTISESGQAWALALIIAALGIVVIAFVFWPIVRNALTGLNF